MRRRNFIKGTAAAIVSSAWTGCVRLQTAPPLAHRDPVIDIHQHTDYAGRSDESLIFHQETMGVTHSVLLPAGRWFGLEARIGPPPNAQRLIAKYPRRFSFFANEVPYISGARKIIEAGLKQGAIGIGEQKFEIDCDSKWLQQVAELAQEYQVPVLMHFQHNKYNTGIERFHKVLEKFPKVNFIGHAQTWWANIDKSAKQEVLYPKGAVAPGGITDRLLADYPNMFGDTSAGSGLNAFTRDPDHMRAFLERHQDKLLYGSDCDDSAGAGAKCQGAQTLEQIRKLAPGRVIERKILYGNAKRLLRLPLA